MTPVPESAAFFEEKFFAGANSSAIKQAGTATQVYSKQMLSIRERERERERESKNRANFPVFRENS